MLHATGSSLRMPTWISRPQVCDASSVRHSSLCCSLPFWYGVFPASYKRGRICHGERDGADHPLAPHPSLSTQPASVAAPWKNISRGDSATFWLCWARVGHPGSSCFLCPPPARLSAAPHHPLTLLPTLHAAMLLPTSGEILSHPFHHLSTTSTVLLNPSSAGLNTHGGARRVGKKEKEVV